MRFKEIRLKEGLFERSIDFADDVNLIYSKENSCGKTTLLRFMLYGLGYSIPNTRKIRFDHCEVELKIECENVGMVTLLRNNSAFIQVTINSCVKTYVLPEQQQELHMLIWGTNNQDVINNLLGAYYVDQEKGWTLLNRGIVIGSIHFNIEELIRGLSGTDCSELIAQEAQLSREIEKYQQMFSVAKYRESIQNEADSLIPDSYEIESDTILDQLLIEQGKIKREIKRIDSALSDNRKFKKFISDMKLLVQAPDGTTFPVTENNIVGLTDSIEILLLKRKLVSAQYSQISRQVDYVQRERKREGEQLSFLQAASKIESFDNNILRMALNPVSVKRELDQLKERKKVISEEISRITKINNSIANIISDNIIRYSTELGLGGKDSISPTYLFTSNLKELSGAILHKTAFAFRLAYIIAIEKVLNIKLPIILDSPSGKEVDPQNIRLMMNILKRDFSDHQIIIASIYLYDFPTLNIIEIKDRLIADT